MMIRGDYAANGRKSAKTSLEIRLAHLEAYFGGTARLARIPTAAVERYKAARLAETAAPATINRELAALRRMATLARHQHGLMVPFQVQMFEERNARQGFFEAEALGAVCEHLRPELAGLARAANITGWRKSELRSRQWPHVDFTAGWLRLEPEETKNREGRQFPLVPELRELLEAQRARVEAIQKKTRRIVPWVFCREDGAPVGDFKKAWATACIKAGFFRVVSVREARKGELQETRKVPTKIFHDTRRSAVRGFERAGVPRSVAMKMTGHKTESVYRRYAIVDEAMLREAGAKIAAAMGVRGIKLESSKGNVVALES
jgi:integrase